jgi:hypothetical protein
MYSHILMTCVSEFCNIWAACLLYRRQKGCSLTWELNVTLTQ